MKTKLVELLYTEYEFEDTNRNSGRIEFVTYFPMILETASSLLVDFHT